jgi:integrase
MLFALATGLRQGNIKGLTWEQVDMPRRIIMLEHGETKNDDALGVPLNDLAISVLERRRGEQCAHVFTYRGRPIHQVNTKAWQNALRRAGISNFRWHDLRHTWASWLRQNDVPTWVLQELGGWKSEVMVRRYAHMSVKHLQPFADQLIFEIKKPVGQVSEKSEAQGHKNGHTQGRPQLYPVE